MRSVEWKSGREGEKGFRSMKSVSIDVDGNVGEMRMDEIRRDKISVVRLAVYNLVSL